MGIPVSVGWSVVAAAGVGAFLLARNVLPTTADDLSLKMRVALAVLAVALFLGSILAHEFGHALTARRHGISTTSVKLWIFGGVAALTSSARSPRAEFQIAVAGPATNAILAGIFGGSAAVSSRIGFPPTTFLLTALAVLNAMLAITNLFPAAPLDGGRILTAAIWRRTGRPEWARLVSARCGIVLSGAVLAFGVVEVFRLDRLSGIYTFAIGLFLGVAARADLSTAVIRGRLTNVQVGDVLTPYPDAIHDSLTLNQLLRMRPSTTANVSLPVQRWSHQTIGYLSTAVAQSMSDADRTWTTVGQLMTPPELVPTAWTSEPLLHALERHGTAPSQLLGIDPKSGLVVGTATPDQFRHFLLPPGFWGGEPRRIAPLRTRAGTFPVPARLQRS